MLTRVEKKSRGSQGTDKGGIGIETLLVPDVYNSSFRQQRRNGQRISQLEARLVERHPFGIKSMS